MSRTGSVATGAAVVLVVLLGAASTATADSNYVVEQSETEVAEGELPEAVPEGFEETEYASWTVDERAEVESRDHGTIYEIEVQKGDKRRGLYFDADGELLDIEVEDAE